MAVADAASRLIAAPAAELRAERALGARSHLALWAALRDRHDVDWYRNPRARDVFRGAGERGASLSIETLSAELGVGEGAWRGRIREWFRG